MNHWQVTIVGFGNVGRALTTLLLQHPLPIGLNVMDPNPQKSGAYLDIFHALHLYDEKSLTINDEKAFEQAHVIFYSAGVQNVHGMGRLSTVEANREITASVFKGRTFHNQPWVVVITNPVDIISYHVQQITGFPANRVIGTGTFLDTVRLEYYLGLLSGRPAHSFSALVLGEHGDSQVPVFSATTVDGQSLLGDASFLRSWREQAAERTKNAAFEIRETQDGTSFGVAKCAERLFDCLVHQIPFKGPISVQSDGYYTALLDLNEPLYISLPVVLSHEGVRYNQLSHFTTSELDALRHSAQVLQSHL